MAKINYDAINFKNKDIDKFAGKFGQGDPVKKGPQKDSYEGIGEHGAGPYSVGMQVGQYSGKRGEGNWEKYGPKSGYSYKDKGQLSSQDSLTINAHRAPTMGNLSMVSNEIKKGTKFPGLSPEFKQSLKTYEKLPAKYK
jgi:hypothetical protein